MENLDLDTQTLLIDLYNQLEGKNEISIGTPIYEKSQVDILVNQKLIQVIDASSLEGWGYIVKSTYQGKKLIDSLRDSLHFRIVKFLKRGEEIGQKEKKENMGMTMVSGPLFNMWIDEIKAFNERYLKKHPLYDSINSTCFHKKNIDAYPDMMGHLRALSVDEELEENQSIRANIPIKKQTISFERMIEEDIEKCERFLCNPDDALGTDLYIEITGKYDAIIPALGQGLYQYIDEYHFYDPEISGDTLKQNLQKLVAKMKGYQATNGYKFTKSQEKKEMNVMGNKVFIVHGHDGQAVSEMARTLEKWGFEAIILHEQADMGLTIIEKIEKFTDVDFAVVLYTECDYGRAKEVDQSLERFRARQNVVFEHGYLISKLGRDHVCALVKGNVETPGDINGVVYVTMDTNGAWQIQLAKNMKAAGLNIDMNRFLA